MANIYKSISDADFTSRPYTEVSSEDKEKHDNILNTFLKLFRGKYLSN